MDQILGKAEKKKQLEAAKGLIKKINASGLKHSHIAKAINVKDETFSRFMSLKDGYVTKRMCDGLKEYFDDIENKNF
jgi:hypothetical protein